jgi:hypothetical protein
MKNSVTGFPEISPPGTREEKALFASTTIPEESVVMTGRGMLSHSGPREEADEGRVSKVTFSRESVFPRKKWLRRIKEPETAERTPVQEMMGRVPDSMETTVTIRPWATN